jgi:beta-aspartyl-peptidase (threonine type)
MDPAKEREYRDALHRSALAGGAILQSKGTACEAAVQAVRTMESSGVFNAGRGSCLNRAGEIEVDAASMCAEDCSIGAVSAVPNTANAVAIAEALRARSNWCFLSGEGALIFAQAAQLEIETLEPTPEKLKRHQQLLETRDPDRTFFSDEDLSQMAGTHDDGDTVGAVAYDRYGCVSCAISTGGLWVKPVGRVGDSPLPGSGYWAQKGVGAVVATGVGEYIMRTLLSSRAISRMASGLDVKEAVELEIQQLSAQFGEGKGGLIAIDKDGNIGYAFDTQGMGRAFYKSGDKSPTVGIWPEDP